MMATATAKAKVVLSDAEKQAFRAVMRDDAQALSALLDEVMVVVLIVMMVVMVVVMVVMVVMMVGWWW